MVTEHRYYGLVALIVMLWAGCSVPESDLRPARLDAEIREIRSIITEVLQDDPREIGTIEDVFARALIDKYIDKEDIKRLTNDPWGDAYSIKISPTDTGYHVVIMSNGINRVDETWKASLEREFDVNREAK